MAKNDSMVDVGLLEFAIREDLEKRAPRALAVLRPLKVVHRQLSRGRRSTGSRRPTIPTIRRWARARFPSRKVVYIEQDDFMEIPPKKWFRLAPGAEMRLRYACLVRCTDVVKNDKGEVVELHCTWDPASRGGDAPDGRRVKGTSHWVSAAHAVKAKVRLYDRLFTVENPSGGDADFRASLNPASLETLTEARSSRPWPRPHRARAFSSSAWATSAPTSSTSKPGAPVFNRTVALKDGWSKIAKTGR